MNALPVTISLGGLEAAVQSDAQSPVHLRPAFLLVAAEGVGLSHEPKEDVFQQTDPFTFQADFPQLQNQASKLQERKFKKC